MKEKCEHYMILYGSRLSPFNMYQEKEFCDLIKEKVYHNYINYVNGDVMDFCYDNFTDFFSPDNTSVEILNYCCDCGEKINQYELKKRINREILEYVSKIKQLPIQKRNRHYIIENNEDKSNRDGYVYLVKLDKHYKIGIAQDPKSRLKEFTLLPYELEYITTAYVNNYAQVEKDLHEKYKSYRVRGEWFELNNQQVKEIVDLLKTIEIKNKTRL